jgi:hypothetical protein
MYYVGLYEGIYTTFYGIAYTLLKNGVLVGRCTPFALKVVDISDGRQSYRTVESQTLHQHVSASKY